MNKFFSKLRSKKSQLLCSSLMLLGVVASSPTHASVDPMIRSSQAQYVARYGPWACPFAQGTPDIRAYSPFFSDPSVLKTTFDISRFSNYSAYFGYGGFGVGVRAVAVALSALTYNQGKQYSSPYGWLNNIASMTDTDVLKRIQADTGITMNGGDPTGIGSLEDMLKGLQASGGFYSYCKSSRNAYLDGPDSGFYQNTTFMPNISPTIFNQRLVEGTAFIVLTNSLVWNDAKGAYGYGEDHLYMVKGEDQATGNVSFYNIADGSTKAVPLQNPRIKNIYSTGVVGGFHTVTTLGGTREVVIGYVGMDAIVNRF